MKSLLIFLPIVAAAVAPVEPVATEPVLGTNTIHGCYSSVGGLRLNETNTFNSQGSCGTACRGVGAYVAATQGNSCYCGDTYPPASTLVDDDQCDEACPGYSTNACGGIKTFTVINTGVKIDVGNSTSDSSSSEVTHSAALQI
jgi:cell wall integrity and stress response component